MDATTLPTEPAQRPATGGGPRVRRVKRNRRLPESLSIPVRIDARTTVGKDVAEFRRDLLRHVGNAPSATQAALIEICCQLRARIVSMDYQFAERGDQSAHASRVYLAWVGAQARVLSRLGLVGQADAVPSLAGYLASRQPRAAPAANGAHQRPRSTHGKDNAAPAPRPPTAHPRRVVRRPLVHEDDGS